MTRRELLLTVLALLFAGCAGFVARRTVGPSPSPTPNATALSTEPDNAGISASAVVTMFTVSGTVIQRETGLGIANATIHVSRDTGGGWIEQAQATTSDTGRFALYLSPVHARYLVWCTLDWTHWIDTDNYIEDWAGGPDWVVQFIGYKAGTMPTVTP